MFGVAGRAPCAVAIIALTSLGLASTASATIDPSAGADTGAAASLGVVAQPGGWLTYTSASSASTALTNPATTTVSGTVLADGSCAVNSSGVLPTDGTESYQEEVGFNPSTCQERVLTGQLSAADAATLNADGPTSDPTVTPQGTTALAAPTIRMMTPQGTPPPEVTQYGTVHMKTAWIDPVWLTITSLATNMRWPLYGAGGTISGRVNPYEFKYDGWSSTGPSSIRFPALAGNVGWSMTESDSFTNRDFAALIYWSAGLAGCSLAVRAPRSRRTSAIR